MAPSEIPLLPLEAKQKEAAHLIAIWVAKIALNNAIEYLDINKASEFLVEDLMNTIYRTSYVNANLIDRRNYPAVDLIDKSSGLGLQVTSTASVTKIRKTLLAWNEHSLHRICPSGLRFFFISNSSPGTPRKSLPTIKPSFDRSSHIITTQDLLRDLIRLLREDEKRFEQALEILRLGVSFNTGYRMVPVDSPAIQADSKEIRRAISAKLQSYHNSQHAKLSSCKTFLHRVNPKPFYEVYFPIQLYTSSWRFINNSKQKFRAETGQMFRNSKYIAIFGGAGSGKSTLMQHLFLDSLRNFHALPIIVPLRRIDDPENLDKFIAKEILNLTTEESSVLWSSSVTKNMLFLFDGYDELSAGIVQRMTEKLDSFVDKHPESKYVVTSRYGTKLELLPRFHNFFVAALDDNEISSFVDQQVVDRELAERVKVVAKLQERRDFLSNPLLLSMFIYNFENFPEVPRKKSRFYENVFETLYQQHDGLSKSGFQRERRTGLLQDDFHNLLQRLCFLTYFQSQYSFDYTDLSTLLSKLSGRSPLPHFVTQKAIYDLEVGISILVKDGSEYSFPHRSLQEYFAAKYVSSLPESKRKFVYEQKLNSLAERGSVIPSLFMEICDELDPICYRESFLIPRIQDYLSHFEDFDLETPSGRLEASIMYLSVLPLTPHISPEGEILRLLLKPDQRANLITLSILRSTCKSFPLFGENTTTDSNLRTALRAWSRDIRKRSKSGRRQANLRRLRVALQGSPLESQIVDHLRELDQSITKLSDEAQDLTSSNSELLDMIE